DAVEVVVLVALLVAREHERGIVRRPDIERAQRARRLAARELTNLARLQIEDVQLDAAALVPVERDLVAAMREDRVVQLRQRPQLANVEIAPRRSGRSHEVADGTRSGMSTTMRREKYESSQAMSCVARLRMP